MNSQAIYMPTGFYRKDLTKASERKLNMPRGSELSNLVPSPMKKIILSFWTVLASRVE